MTVRGGGGRREGWRQREKEGQTARRGEDMKGGPCLDAEMMGGSREQVQGERNKLLSGEREKGKREE